MADFLFNIMDRIFYNTPFWADYDVYFYILILCAVGFALYINYGKIAGSLKEKRGKIITAILLLSILTGSYIRISNMSFEYNFNDSTWEYIHGARYFSETGRIFKCYGPSFYECAGPAPISHPALFSLLLGLIFSLLGYNAGIIVLIAVAVSILTIPFSYFSIKEFLESKIAGGIGAAGLSVFPLHAIHSGNLDMALSVFSVLSIFFVFYATGSVLKESSKKNWILLMASYLFAVSFRWEHPLLIIFSLATIFLTRDKPVKYFKNLLKEKWFWFYGVIFSILAVAPLKGIYTVWFRQESLGRSFTWAFFMENLSLAWKLLSSLYYLPGLVFILLIPFAFKKNYKKASVLTVWWLTYIGLYAFFRNGLTDRYVMNSIPPLIVIGCMGFSYLIETEPLKRRNKKQIITAVFAFIILISAFIPLGGNSVLRQELYKRDDVGGFHEISNDLDKPIIVPMTNALLSIITESDKTIYSFLSLSLHENWNIENRFYFIETERCKHEPAEKVCDRITDDGDEKIKLNDWNVYVVEFTEDLRKDIEYMVSEEEF